MIQKTAAFVALCLFSTLSWAHGARRPRSETPVATNSVQSSINHCEDTLVAGLDRLDSRSCLDGQDQQRVRAIYQPYLDWGMQDRQTVLNGGALNNSRLQGRLELCQATADNLTRLFEGGLIACPSAETPTFSTGTESSTPQPAPTTSVDGAFAGGHSGAVYTSNGNTTIGSDGTVYTTTGNTTVSSNGVVYTTSGNTTVSSNGVVYTRSGNTVVGSDGTVCTESGSTTICN